MMFTKYLAVVSGNINIRDYGELIRHIFSNTDFESDIIFTRGPLDVLDHSSDSFSFGGKAGIDATVKLPEEVSAKPKPGITPEITDHGNIEAWLNKPFIKSANPKLINKGIKILIIGINPSEDPGSLGEVVELLKSNNIADVFRLVVVIDHSVDAEDVFAVAWQILANSDPLRDHFMISSSSMLIDGTIKLFRKGGFSRRWPNIVCSDASTIESIDIKWESLGFDVFNPSPSLKYSKLTRSGTDEIIA
jgi:4-hydroxy-3-polyprenylbenzoate decarboxylase